VLISNKTRRILIITQNIFKDFEDKSSIQHLKEVDVLFSNGAIGVKQYSESSSHSFGW
jgi:hypothetical protein